MATAAEIQAIALAQATTTVAEFKAFLAALQAATISNDVAVIVPNPELVLIPEDFLYNTLAALTSSQPIAPTLAFGASNAPTAPTIGAFTLPTLVNLPEFSLVEPVITIPAAPTGALPTAPGQAPEINTPVLPTRPVFSLPPAPTFTPVSVPTAPAVVIPSFTSTMPVDDIVAPSVTFDYAEAEYTSALRDTVKAKLLTDLTEGGYGIDTNDELQIWERARDRELRATEVSIQEVSRRAAALGGMLPQGALHAQIEAAQQASLEKSSTLGRDIAVKRADMFVENRKFTIEQSIGLEKVLMDFYGAVAERALNAAKATVELGIALFNSAVARYNIKLQAYKVSADVYETQIRGAILVVEAYKSEVEAAKLTADIQQVYATIYRTQLDGVKTLIDMYRTEMEAAQVQAEIEKLKLDAFRTSVDTYVAQVGARTAEFQMFESRIKGETAKIGAFKASVDAYATRVEAHKSRASVEESVARVQIAQAESKLSLYRTDMERYRADIQAVAEVVRTSVAKYSAQVQMFSAKAGAVGKAYDLASANQQANASIYAEASRQAIQSAVHRLDAFIKINAQRIGAAESGAKALGSVAASAASAVVGLASTTQT
jgi:predicted  nucleic acid-binding Zn-ribbon protein